LHLQKINCFKDTVLLNPIEAACYRWNSTN